LENQLSELTERYESELRLREFAEKEKKNIASGIAQQSSMLDEKHSKIEYLTTELGKYEAELVQLRNKFLFIFLINWEIITGFRI